MKVDTEYKIQEITHRRDFFIRALEVAVASNESVESLGVPLKTKMHTAYLQELEERIAFLQNELEKLIIQQS
jgi:uncharacterized small protein (DUF1192 family)